MIFREELRQLNEKHTTLTVVERFTDIEGMAAEEFWQEADLEKALHLERFSVDLGGGNAKGGTITFANSGKPIEVDGATTLMVAGEQAGVGMPYGCRIGICHTCTP